MLSAPFFADVGALKLVATLARFAQYRVGVISIKARIILNTGANSIIEAPNGIGSRDEFDPAMGIGAAGAA